MKNVFLDTKDENNKLKNKIEYPVGFRPNIEGCKLTFLADIESKGGRKCDCGNEKIIKVESVLRANTKSCSYICYHSNYYDDFIGGTYGDLFIESYGPVKQIKHKDQYINRKTFNVICIYNN